MTTTLVQQLIDLVRALDDLKRRRVAFLKERGNDEVNSHNSRIAGPALKAGDARATDAFIRGEPAEPVDAEAFRGEMKNLPTRNNAWAGLARNGGGDVGR